MTLPETVSPLELGWTLIGIFGFVCNMYVFDFWRLRLGEAKRSGSNGRLSHQLWTHLYEEIISTLVQWAAVAAGVISMMLPPANPETPVTLGGVVVAGLIVFIEVALAGKALMKLARWHEQRRMGMAARERHGD